MKRMKDESCQLLLVGNNPKEMSELYEKLHSILPKKINAGIVFELKGLVQTVKKMKPKAMIIDELFGYFELKDLFGALSKSRSTRDISITLLKSSSFTYSYKLGVDNYILKEGISAKRLYQTVQEGLAGRKIKQLHRLSA